MTHVVEDRYFILCIPVRESQSVRYYAEEDLGLACGYRLTRDPARAAHLRDLTAFVREHRDDLDADARHRSLGTLIWTAITVTERRLELHEETYPWSGLVNARPPSAAPARIAALGA